MDVANFQKLSFVIYCFYKISIIVIWYLFEKFKAAHLFVWLFRHFIIAIGHKLHGRSDISVSVSILKLPNDVHKNLRGRATPPFLFLYEGQSGGSENKISASGSGGTGVVFKKHPLYMQYIRIYKGNYQKNRCFFVFNLLNGIFGAYLVPYAKGPIRRNFLEQFQKIKLLSVGGMTQ